MKSRRSAGNLVLSTRPIVGTLAAGGLAGKAGTSQSRRSKLDWESSHSWAGWQTTRQSNTAEPASRALAGQDSSIRVAWGMVGLLSKSFPLDNRLGERERWHRNETTCLFAGLFHDRGLRRRAN